MHSGFSQRVVARITCEPAGAFGPSDLFSAAFVQSGELWIAGGRRPALAAGATGPRRAIDARPGPSGFDP
jgi:hypothetical protein